MSVLVEACCGSVEEVLLAEKAGVDRIELCDNLEVGGLTPSEELVRSVKQNSSLPIMAMLRPRKGDFFYTDGEYKIMFEQAERLIAQGVEGIVFGILRQDNTIDAERCKNLIRHISHESFKLPKRVQIVFHKAFDEVPDWKMAVSELINLSFDRVLTSGHCQTALEGAQELAEIQNFADKRIEVLAGGGVRKDNVVDVINQTRVKQVHLKCFDLETVVTLCHKPLIS